MRSMWSKYYRDCHGVIFLIDSSDPDRFKEVKDELRLSSYDLLFLGDLATNADLEDLPILICANKQDSAVVMVYLLFVSFLTSSDSSFVFDIISHPS